MNLVRNALIIGIIIVSFLLLREWSSFDDKQKELAYLKEKEKDTAGINENLSSNNTQIIKNDAPVLSASTPDIASPALVVPQDIPDEATQNNDESVLLNKALNEKLIQVKTNNLNIAINPRGGDIEKVSLPQHYRKLDTPDEPFILISNSNSKTYIAQSGLMGKDGIDSKGTRPLYNVAQRSYELTEKDGNLDVDFTHSENGINYIKRFSFEQDSYLINISYIIENTSSNSWQGKMFGIIRRDDTSPDIGNAMRASPYLGGAITTDEKNYKEITFDDLEDDGPFTAKKQGGWVAMVQHYFMSAWIPNKDDINKYQMQKIDGSFNGKNQYQFGFTGAQKTVNANETITINSAFYAGPKDINSLEKISPYLDLTIDYSFLWFIAKPLFKALSAIQSVIGNWGFAIIILTCFIKLLFLYPSAMSYRSMARMKKVAPKLAALKERYGDDRQKMSGELMKLYKEEKVNPLGGCLPMLLQMPVFLSLYWVILESVELRHSPFILWIQDLSIKDPLFILPVLMGLSMFIQQKLNPTPPDPMQAKVMKMLPIVFTALFMFFPAGLVLYWVVNNSLSIVQQYVITKQIEKAA